MRLARIKLLKMVRLICVWLSPLAVSMVLFCFLNSVNFTLEPVVNWALTLVLYDIR